MKKIFVTGAVLLLCIAALSACSQDKAESSTPAASTASTGVVSQVPEESTTEMEASTPEVSAPSAEERAAHEEEETETSTVSFPKKEPAEQEPSTHTSWQPSEKPSVSEQPSTQAPQTPSSTPEPAPTPEPEPDPTPSPQPSDPFDYPFNPEQIVAEMRSYGESLGLTYGMGASHGQTVTASQSFQGANLKKGLQNAISFLLSDEFQEYGGQTPTHFKIGYSGSNGHYIFAIYY